MELKHTKGEWKIRFFGGEDDGENMFFIEAPNLNKPELGYGIEIMMEDFGDHNGYPREQRLADAKLIVASKAMLSYLQNLMFEYKQSGIDETSDKYKTLKSLIDKATL